MQLWVPLEHPYASRRDYPKLLFVWIPWHIRGKDKASLQCVDVHGSEWKVPCYCFFCWLWFIFKVNYFPLLEIFGLLINFTLHLYLSLNILSQKEHFMFFIFKWVELIWRLKWSAFMNPTPHSEHKWGLKGERTKTFQWLIVW